MIKFARRFQSQIVKAEASSMLNTVIKDEKALYQ